MYVYICGKENWAYVESTSINIWNYQAFFTIPLILYPPPDKSSLKV